GYWDWKKGVELVRKQEWEPAIFYYQRALGRLEEKGELSYHLGSAMVFNGQYSKGIYWLGESKKDFNDRNIYLSESLANLKLGKLEKAEQSAKRALCMFPTHLAPHLLLGEIYYEEDRIKESKASLIKCINEDISIKSVE